MTEKQPPKSDTTNEKRTLKDVDHTPPAGQPVSNVWERGSEETE
jgi:hypothetical protein